MAYVFTVDVGADAVFDGDDSEKLATPSSPQGSGSEENTQNLEEATCDVSFLQALRDKYCEVYF